MKIEELCKEIVDARIEAGYLESNAWTCYSEFLFPSDFILQKPWGRRILSRNNRQIRGIFV